MTTRPPKRSAVDPVPGPVVQPGLSVSPPVAGRPGTPSSPPLAPWPREAAGSLNPVTGALTSEQVRAPGRGRAAGESTCITASHAEISPAAGTRTPASGGRRRAAGALEAGSTPAVTRLASIPPWPAPPAPADVLLQLRLSLPPVTESRARISPAEYTWIGDRKVKTRKAHGYKEAALADYQDTVGWLLRQARITRNDDDQLGVYGVFHLPAGAGAADGDNLLKSITDAGNGITWKDDRQFTVWLAHVIRGSSDPHTDLVVYVSRPRTGVA